VRARPPGRPVSLSTHAQQGTHRIIALASKDAAAHARTHTVQDAVRGRVDDLGTYVLAHRTITHVWLPACPKIGASALPVSFELPAVARQEWETRSGCFPGYYTVLIATGLWMPCRFHSVAPKVPSDFDRLYRAWLCPWDRIQTAGKVGCARAGRKLQLSGMPELIGHLWNAQAVLLTVLTSVCVDYSEGEGDR
jgi:hypothetical protein